MAAADCIVVLSDGAVIETGTHEELLARDGVYADMWNAQSRSDDSLVTEGNSGECETEEEIELQVNERY